MNGPIRCRLMGISLGFWVTDCSVVRYELQVGKKGSQVGKIAVQVGKITVQVGIVIFF